VNPEGNVVTTASTLTSGKIMTGNGLKTTQTTGVGCDSSGNLTGVTSIASGSGSLSFPNLGANGLVFGTDPSITTGFVVSALGDLTKNCVVQGVHFDGAGFYPFIGAQIPGASWSNLCITPNSGTNTTIGYTFGGGSSSYNTDLNGTVNVNQSLYVGGTLAINVSGAERNATFTKVNGLYPSGFQGSAVKGVIYGDVSSTGTVLVQTGGLSCTYLGTGSYQIDLSAASCYGSQVTGMSPGGQYGYVTCERITSAQYKVFWRTSSGLLQDQPFSFSCAYN
jgi:hypothetical protein